MCTQVMDVEKMGCYFQFEENTFQCFCIIQMELMNQLTVNNASKLKKK